MSLKFSQTAHSPALRRWLRPVINGWLVVLTVFVSQLAAAEQAEEKPDQPNIIFILADDK